MQAVKQTVSTVTGMDIDYKLKGLTSLDLKNGEMREAEVEGIEGGKILLVKLDGETHAMSPNCTHFGAPLKNGVLSPDGFLTCPWHGACFNIKTGDVEDAPAPDNLAKFPVSEKDGAVYITGNNTTIKNMRKSPGIKCAVQGPEKVVIVGGGDGAFGAVQSLRVQGFNGSITIISSEGYPPIDRTKLSKALIPDASKLALRSGDWYSAASVNLINDEVTKVDFSGKNVSTKSEKDYSYTKLILATGGTPNMLPLPGFKDLGNVFLLRTVQHVQGILSAVGNKGKQIVIIGSSFIGMEVANALAKENTVTVVGMEEAPLERVMGKQVGQIFQNLLEKSGVNFRMGASVEKAIPSLKNPTDVGGVQLKDGTTLDADLVILGVGVKPATAFLKRSSAQLEKDGSLKTNESFEVSGLKDVYAIGDIATYPYHGPGGNGSLTRIEHWNVAQNAGRSVGFTITHPNGKPKSFIPIFWSALGSQLRYCGNTPNGWDDLVLKGDPDNGKFAAYYCKGETVVAVASMMMDPIMSKSAELMRRGKMPSKTELENGIDPLNVSVPSEIKM
ncbi:MAG: hypothetical protein M1834_004651 [Cirrosporium novae-zelandiae]|nr:MAG: hypothetical protein M1834_004651 [Cirrosporium novae-zelandiae]